jgi:hypothetical protein
MVSHASRTSAPAGRAPGVHAGLAALLTCALALGAGCSQTADLDDLEGLLRSGGRTGGGANGQGGNTGNSGSPSNGTAPADEAPKPGGVPHATTEVMPTSCKMWDQGNQTCVACVDATGKVVRNDCYDRGGTADGSKCEETKTMDGNLCIVCWDAKGTEIKRDCRMPANTCGMPVPPPSPPIPAICRDLVEKDVKCVVCLDAATGKEVSRACSGPAMPAPMPTGEVTCVDSSYADGTKCTVCTDAKGNVIKKGCWTPAPTPTEPSMISCKDYEQNGAHCTVCTDATGAVVKQGCSTPATMPAPTPTISCRTYKDPMSVCIVCTDENGKVVKQDCQPNTNK